MLGHLYLQASVSQPSLSQAPQDESVIGFLLLPGKYFVEFDFIEFALQKQ